MSYQNYQVSDFVTDDFFRRWVISPNQKTNAYWQTWCEQHPEKASVIQQARALVLMTNVETIDHTNEDQQETWENINRLLDQPETKPDLPQRFSTRPSYRWFKLAATLTGFLLVSLYITYAYFNDVEEYHTGYGQVATITLPDGSTAILNANSTLQVASRWQQKRKVWLEGEAYFAVEKSLDSANQNHGYYRKFTVHAGEVAVEVLGTRFNVQNRPQTTQVILEEGVVTLKNAAQNEQPSIQLGEGEVATYLPEDDSFRRGLADTEALLSWKEGMHVFKASRLQEVAQTIENIYGYQVRVSADIQWKRFSAKIPYEQIDLLLDLLSESLDLKIIEKDSVILIQPR